MTEHEHRIHRWIDEAGYAAACRCGWRTSRPTHELRDRDAAAHIIRHEGPARG